MLYNIDFSIASMLFLVIFILFIKTQYVNQTKSNRIFVLLLWSVLAADLLDVLSAVTISYTEHVPLWVNHIVNLLYYLLANVGTYYLPIYIRYLIDEDSKTKAWDYINNLVFGFYFVLCITNPFTKILFYFDENKVYKQGPLYYLLSILPLYYLIGSFARIVINRAKIQKLQFYSMVGFVLTTLIGTALQIIFFPKVLLIFFGISIAIMMLLFSFETPDYQKLVKTTEELKHSQTDLLEAKEKEEEATRVLHELMGSADWRLELDETGQTVTAQWSSQFRRMMGVEDESYSKDVDLWSERLHPDDHDEAMNSFLKGLQGIEPYDITFRLLDRTGEYRWYHGLGEVKRDQNGIIRVYQGVIQDVHNEKITEILSKQRQEALEELQVSQKALKEALNEAQQANVAKSRFLSNMSHDIRTPMNAIVGFTDLALDNMEDSTVVRDYLDKIQTSSNHLLLLINDILDMSRIESGKVNIEPAPCDINEIVESLDRIIDVQASAKGVRYFSTMDEIKDSRVVCDRLRLNQILLNCVGNSVKFTPDGGEVGIIVQEIMGDNAGEAEFCFIIADTGIGMDEEFLAHLYEPFERERTSTISKTQGTGLGMSITKSLVEMMGGTIFVESRVGEGTTYVITIPMELAGTGSQFSSYVELDEEKTIEEMTQFLAGRHVLLVDDNATNRTLAKGVLKAKGLTFDEADDGSRAVDIIKNSEPGEYEIILMDVQMPIMDGYTATDIIRSLEDEVLANIPILAMTANAFEEDKQECLAHGMNGHLAKPFKPDDLVRKIYECLTK